MGLTNVTQLPEKTLGNQRLARHVQLYLLILPAVVSVFIFHYVPIYGVQIAFRNYRPSLGIWGSDWVGMRHFIRFFTFPDFWRIVRNTLTISLYTLATLFPASVILALIINEIAHKKFKRYVQMVSYAPHFVSTVVVCSMVVLFTKYESGMFNSIREILGLERIALLTIPEYFSSLYVWSGVWQKTAQRQISGPCALCSRTA